MAEEYQNDLQLSLDKKTKELVKQLPDFAKKFFKDLKTKGMSERTRVEYAYDLKRFFDYIQSSAGFKNKSLNGCTASDVLDKLTYDDIQEYLDTLNIHTVIDKRGKEKEIVSSPSSKARKISSLRSFYKFYFKIGEIKTNLADLMELPKIPDKNIVTMDKDQVQRILDAVSDTTGMTDGKIKRHSKIVKRDYAIMMLFFGTGIRVSELVGIDLSDIDFYNASLFITRKGGDEDEVFFGSEVQEALEDYAKNDRDILLDGKDETALFISMQHKRMTVRSVELMIKGYAEKAGLNMKVTPHALRRTFASQVYESSNDIFLVAEALHHSSVETTRKHYAKMSDSRKREAAKAVGDLFKSDNV
ncbi:MAG: tyrosine-type recombinase/integrase [Erysipelotrichaceae bacterium]|nr:tyrosine-type recombinase/integrase [Erysipelotrichaceae bacterium]